MSGSGMKGAAFSVAFHAAAIAVVFFLSAKTKGEPVVSSADPLLALLADPDADPTKDAGSVGETRGIAEGTPDGTELRTPSAPDEGVSLKDLSELIEESEKILNTPLPEPEPAPVPAEPEPAPVPAKPEPAPEPPKKTPRSGGGDSKPKQVSYKDWKKKQSTQNAGGKKTPPKKNGKGGGKTVSVPKIDVDAITGRGGSGNGKRFGAPGGTGGNGGDGGAAVASARQTYVAELEKKLAAQLDGVLTQTPLKLDGAVVVKVSLAVDSRGNVRLLDVHGASDPQVRDRVSKAVVRLGKFRAPPGGKAFEILIPRVELRPQL